MKKIFISYCWSDENEYNLIAFINKLMNYMKISKQDYFIDKKDNFIGESYWDKIYEAINASNIFIFFNSWNYYTSSSCCKEYVWALGKGLKIIEIKLDNKSKLFRFPKNRLYVNYDVENIFEIIKKGIVDNNYDGFKKPNIVEAISIDEYSDNNANIINVIFKTKIDNLILFFIFNKENEINYDQEKTLLHVEGGNFLIQNTNFENNEIKEILFEFKNINIYKNQNRKIYISKKIKNFRIFIFDPNNDDPTNLDNFCFLEPIN